MQQRLLILAVAIISSNNVVIVFGSVHRSKSAVDRNGGVRRRSSASSSLQHDHHHRLSTPDSTLSGIDAALFEGDLLVSYTDIAANYGKAVADKLVDTGFAFTDSSSNSPSNDTTTNARKLGLTNEYIQQTWNIPHYRQTSTGKLRIPYVIENTIPFQQNNNETPSTIKKALSIIEQTTGVIAFVPRQSAIDVDYIHFRYMANMCAATLGRSSPSIIYIGWCNTQAYTGEIIHEILHTLGFWHEQSRPDRDLYITYNKQNVISGMELNFEKQININSLGSMYDYYSIMHYPANAFSIYPGNDMYDTLVPINQDESLGGRMGQSLRMSPTDVQQLRLLYQCNTGPRNINDITIDTLCSINCKCWEYAIGSCHGNDEECMGELICGAPPATGIVPESMMEYQDMLPRYNLTVARFHVGYCSTYCHADCCHLTDSQVLCPDTCDTWSSPVDEELPRTLCMPNTETTATATTNPTMNPTSAPTSSRPTTLKPTSARPMLLSSSPPTPPTPPPSVNTGFTPMTQWYVDWSRNGGMCVADCEGTQPCGRKRHSWEAGYISVQVCCSTMSWKPYNDCSYAIVGTTTTTTTSTTSATTPATSSTTTTRATATTSTTSTPPGTVSTSTATTSTSATTTSTSTSTTTTASTTTATTSSPTASPVTTKPTSSLTLKPTASPTMTVIPPVNTQWYPDPAGTTKCKNDGLAPSWLHHKYTAQSTCCTSHFSWGYNDCMGTKPASSNKWYIDWSIGKCKQDCDKTSSSTTCGGIVPGSWILLHTTSDACCRAHVSYAVDQCKTLG